MIKKTIVLVLFFTSMIYAEPLSDGFRNPPQSAKPRSLWCWVNGNVSLSQITEELKDARDKGLGGLDIWDIAGWVYPDHVIPDGPAFMGDESVQAIAHTIREAEKYGIDIGLTISSSWNAGGSWIQPEHGAMGLFRSERMVHGPSHFSGNMPFPELPTHYRGDKPMIQHLDASGRPVFWKPVAVLAMPLGADSTLGDTETILDLSDQMDENGNITWDVPEGNWRLVRYVCAPTGQPMMRPSPLSNGLMIDHFSREALDDHLQFFIDKLETELGSLNQTALKYFYTDSYEVNSAVWTPDLPHAFKKRRGYDLLPWLPALDGFVVGNQDLTERFLFDFRKCLSDLIIENHYGRGREIAHKIGLEFHAEAGGPGPPVHNCPFEDIKSLGSLDAPRGEFWNNHPRGHEHNEQLQIVKGPASAAHLYNQPYVEAEAFTSVWMWQEGPNDLKAVLDRALCEGLTRIVYHTQPHIPSEAGFPGWVYNFGTLMGPTRAWWPLARGLNDYIARSSYLLMQGHFVGDVLFYYGDEAPNFVKPKHIADGLGYGYDYDICNSDIILNRLDVIDDRIVLPHGQSYQVLVLPGSGAANPDVMLHIEALVNKGMTVIGPRPEKSCSLNQWEVRDRQVREIAERLWGEGRVIEGKSIRQVLMEKGIGPDLEVQGTEDPTVIDYIHRQTETADIYMLRNTGERAVDVDCIFRIHNKQPEFWYPETGEIEKVYVYRDEASGTQLPIQLQQTESVFVVFRGPVERHVTCVKENKKLVFPVQSNSGTRCIDAMLRTDHTVDLGLILSDGSIICRKNTRDSKTVSCNTDWQIRFPFGWGTPSRLELSELKDWTLFEDVSIRHFSGVVAYYKSVTLTSGDLTYTHIFLDLGQVEEVAHIFVNGHDMGIQSFSPYRIDMTDVVKEGENFFVIEVANLMNNCLVGDGSRSWEEKHTRTNITKGPTPWSNDWKDVPLKPSGLIGPVQILFENQIVF